MENSQNKTLVIIVTYNGMKWLRKCLDSVVNSTISLDAYIVDNGSTDGSQKFITDNYPQFTFYQSPTNSGFGAANNIALKYAIELNYDYVYLLNQDAWVDTDTISTLIKQQKLNPEYGVISPLQVNAEKTKLDHNFGHCAASNNNLLSDAILGTLNNIYNVGFVMAAHWLISRECLHKVGLFSPVFYHYGEDDNYLHRLTYHGFKTGIVPTVIGVHDREFRDMTKGKEVYMLYPVFLVSASNINRNFFTAAASSYCKLLRFSWSLSLKYKDILIFFRSINKCISLLKVFNDRKINAK